MSGGGMTSPRAQFGVRMLALWVVVASAGLWAACGTPEGGTSIPWNRPQTWEHQMPMGISPGSGR